MNPNPGREAAYVTSRVKDLSLITNTPDYTGLFACITPKAGAELNEEENYVYLDSSGNKVTAESGEKTYLPQLVRDVATLDALFGDPRVDPSTYRDLYAVRSIVQSGFACYIAKIRSGEEYKAEVDAAGLFTSGIPCNPQMDGDGFRDSDRAALQALRDELRNLKLFTVESSVVGDNVLTVSLIPVKPYSLNQVLFSLVFTTQATPSSDVAEVANIRSYLSLDMRNADLVKALNSYLGGEVVLYLPESMDDSDYPTVEDATVMMRQEGKQYYCIANVLLYICGLYQLNARVEEIEGSATHETEYVLTDGTDLIAANLGLVGLKELSGWTDAFKSQRTFMCSIVNTQQASLDVHQQDYVRSLYTFKDARYTGTFISDLASPVTVLRATSAIYALDMDGIDPANFSSVMDTSSYRKGAGYYKKIQYYKNGAGDNALSKNNIATIYHENEDDPFKPTDADIAEVEKAKYTRAENTGEGGGYIYTKAEASSEGPFYVLKSGHEFDYSPDYASAIIIVEGAEDIFEEEAEDGSNLTFVLPVYTPSSRSAYTILYARADVPSLKGDDANAIKAYKDKSAAWVNSGSPFYYIVEQGKYTLLDVPDDFPTRPGGNILKNELAEMSSENRRGLHYIIKEVAAQRKDVTCIFTTPYHPTEDGDEDLFDITRACNWVAARGEFADLFEYGNVSALDYSEQSFYCEMYWSWVKWNVAKLVNGLATGSATVVMPATPFVILNSLMSYRSRGAFYPVAGDQGGVLPASCVILQNPSTKGQRDKLVSYRINPIYDTGTRGVQIYGNETLNASYTDLSAAHIARTLVQIRAQVDAFSETIKFSLNDKYTWAKWINYVDTRVLDPIKANGGLQWYQVDMGEGTTTQEEIAQRKIRGMVSLQFTQSLEILDLEFVVYASSLDMEATEEG